METPLQNLKYYFRNNETITKEELLIAIDDLIDNERAFFINAFEHGYASSGLIAIESNKAFEAYNKLYNDCNLNEETNTPIFITTNNDIMNSVIIYLKTQDTEPIYRVFPEYNKLSTEEKFKVLDSLNNWVHSETTSILKEKYQNQ